MGQSTRSITLIRIIGFKYNIKCFHSNPASDFYSNRLANLVCFFGPDDLSRTGNIDIPYLNDGITRL